MGFVELINIRKYYGSIKAVDDISLVIEKGEFITLLGPSGCGKSTTLRVVAGFVKPDAGQIYVNGALVNDKPPYHRNMGMVFQSYALFPHMTVYDNVAFGLRMRKQAGSEVRRKAKLALDIVRLSEMELRFPRQLSGGQQQRVALARALVIEPDLLLLDEPLSNLDFKLRLQMRLEIKSIQKRLGITSIYVTHDQAEALTMSDRIVVINQGKIQQIGSPSGVYEAPRNRFVADFIGEANLIEGRVSMEDGKKIIITDDGLLIATEGYAQLSPGNRITVCVRPRKIMLSKENKSAERTLEGRILHVVYRGDDIRYHVEVGNRSLLVDEPLIHLEKIPKAGEKIYLWWKPTDTIVLQSDFSNIERGA